MVEQGSGKTIVRDYYESLLIAFIFVNFARIFVFQAFKIPSGSMYDNLLVGDHIIVNKFVYGPEASALFRRVFPLKPIERGDIVIFRFPQNPANDFVKRVIALPGEEISIRDKVVYIDGRALREDYKVHTDRVVYPKRALLPEPWRSRDQLGPYRVPAGTYFVLGDNRDKSNDSRFWGPVPRSLIKGRAFMIYWSFRGIPAPPGSPPTERFRELLNVVVRFFSHSRWDRSFKIIDQQHHYTEPENFLEYQ